MVGHFQQQQQDKPVSSTSSNFKLKYTLIKL